MHLVQLLLPLVGNRKAYDNVMHELTERFGGATAYARAPAAGLWKNRAAKTEGDDIVVVEVMVSKLNRKWWAKYRRELEKRLDQEELIVRAHKVECL
ncbi:MAG TPA: hypothetical protein VM183_00975 [Burkholderiales bacterium]|nr:hypothetical protein [Burkholderiales bacterium]